MKKTLEKFVVALALFTSSTCVWAFESLPAKPPIPENNPMTKEKIELGRMLYFDKRLSADNTVSCNTCHNPNTGGVDHLPFSVGIKGQKGGRNSPTVLNAAFQSVQFWDGRAPSLEEQAKGPLINPKEMGMPDHSAVVAKVKEITGYAPFFKKAFAQEADAITIDTIAKAIASYERTLITRNSAFDKYLAGNKKALDASAQKGMMLFQTVGCVACHSGANFSGPMLPEGTGFFMRFPTYDNAELEAKYKFKEDNGHHDMTKNEIDRHMYRIPSLRNIANTAPYFHNGAVSDLSEAVRVMVKLQLNKEISDTDVNNLVAFLKSLSGTLPEQKEPKLPI